MNESIEVSESLRSIGEIENYHAHIYFEGDSQRAGLLSLRDAIATRFPVQFLAMLEEAVGIHPKPMLVVAFMPDEFEKLVPWLMLNRGDLTILVHPNTDNALGDHLNNALWLGSPVAFRSAEEVPAQMWPTVSLKAQGRSHPPVIVDNAGFHGST